PGHQPRGAERQRGERYRQFLQPWTHQALLMTRSRVHHARGRAGGTPARPPEATNMKPSMSFLVNMCCGVIDTRLLKRLTGRARTCAERTGDVACRSGRERAAYRLGQPV